MNRDEQKLRDALERRLGDLRPAISFETIRRGANRGRIIIALATALAVSIAGIGGYVLIRATGSTNDRVVGPGPGTGDGLIAFSRFGEDGGIMTMNADGSGVERSVAGDGYAFNRPAWSPDGERIAFHGFSGPASTEAGGLFVMDADGSDVKLVEEAGDAPTWSPDGERIAFYSSEDGTLRVKTLDEKLSETIVEQDGYRIDTPDWSPDGQRLVFGGDSLDILNLKDRSRDVLLHPPGGSGQMLLDPAWSPDGTRIAYTEYTDTDDPSEDMAIVKVIEVETFRNWTLGEGADPTWSPDGERVAFERANGDSSHIYSIDADGTGEQQLTFGDVADHSPDWSASTPDEHSRFATFGRYFFHIQGGFNEDSDTAENPGVVEVNSREGTLCVNSYLPGATSAHLRREGADPWDPIVIFEVPTKYRSSMCARGLDEPSLQTVIDDPTAYFIEFTNKFTGETLIARLEPMGEPTEPRSETNPYCVADEICLDPGSAPAGSTVTASIPASGTGENGVDEIGTDRVEWWWGLEGNDWVDVVQGDPPRGAFMLASAEEPRKGRLITSFVVPFGNEPGIYPIFAIRYGGGGSNGAEINFTIEEGYGCPELVEPGPDGEEDMLRIVDRYLIQRQPEGAEGFNYRQIDPLDRPIIGGPQGDCKAEIWLRSYVVEGSYQWKEGERTSASLSYFRFVVGRAEGDWVVWAVLH